MQISDLKITYDTIKKQQPETRPTSEEDEEREGRVWLSSNSAATTADKEYREAAYSSTACST